VDEEEEEEEKEEEITSSYDHQINIKPAAIQ